MINKKNNFKSTLTNYFFFLLFFFFTSCTEYHSPSSSLSHVSSKDETWIKKFVEEFFLEDVTIYTLFGSKPMSAVTIMNMSEEDLIESSMPILEHETEEKKIEIINEIRRYYQDYDLAENYHRWIDWRKECKRSPYLFTSRPVPWDENIFNVYVIHIPEVIWTLQEHYSLFAKELKMEFDPFAVTLEFEDSSSLFWEKIFMSHFLQGILFGFGEKNAYFFSCRDQEKELLSFKNCLFGKSTKIENQGNQTHRIELPSFRSYATEKDPLIEKYEMQRNLIEEFLEGKDFTDEALKKICNCSMSRPSASMK